MNGGWVKSEGRKTYDTHNPATGEKLGATVQGVFVCVLVCLCACVCACICAYVC